MFPLQHKIASSRTILTASIDHPFEGLSHTLVESTGPVPSTVLFVGEAPGETEDETGRCFTGKTGQELDRFYLPAAALRRHEVRVTNLVPCYPYTNRDPTAEEIKFFEHILYEEIIQTQPRVVVPLGAVAVRWFLGGHRDLHTIHGLPYVSDKAPGAIVIPSYHPAAGLHNTDTQPLIVYDFQQIYQAVIGKLPPRPIDHFPEPVPAYIELETAGEVLVALEDVHRVWMGMDTEGYRGNPWGLSFSIDSGVAYVIRIRSKDALREFAAYLDRHPEITVILHNALHDLPILREMGVTVKTFEDTMVYAYCLCLEPQGLKDSAYRNCGMHMKSYEEVTVPAMRKLTTEYLIRVASSDWGLDSPVPQRESDQQIKYRQPQALHKRAMHAVNDILGMWTGSIIGPRRGGSAGLKELGVRVGKVDVQTAQTLQLPKDFTAWECAVPVPVKPKLDVLYGDYIFDLNPPAPPDEPANAAKRWTDMSVELEESVERCEKSIGVLTEIGLDAIEDQEVAVRYSAKDSDATLRNHAVLRKRVEDAGLMDLAQLDMAVLPYIDRMRTVGIRINSRHMLDYGKQLAVEMRQIQEKLHKDLGLWINPSSSQQVGLVIYDILGFPVEFRTEKGQPSTNDKVLEALAPLHENITDITDYRELHKLHSTFCIKLPRWMDKYCRLHTNFKYTRVASGRLATSDPNLLGIPTRTDRGKMIRKGFVPGPGRVFISCDLSQIEVRVTAHYSRDTNLIKIFTGTGVDFHVRTAAQMWKLTDEQIKADDELNGGASMRSSAKNISFGILYGVSAKGLQAQLKSKCHTDWTEEQCQEMIDLWLDTAYPQVRYYMEQQKRLCRQRGYVESLHGRRRYLPGVRSSIPRIREEAYRAAINHPIQASASEILKIAMKNIWNDVLPLFWDSGVYVEPILAIHDELLFECDAGAATDFMNAAIYEMEHALKLCVPVVSKGKIAAMSWGDLK